MLLAIIYILFSFQTWEFDPWHESIYVNPITYYSRSMHSNIQRRQFHMFCIEKNGDQVQFPICRTGDFRPGPFSHRDSE